MIFSHVLYQLSYLNPARLAGIWEVQPHWVQEHLREVQVIDVREPNEFDGPLGRIPGAVSIPLGALAARACGILRWRAQRLAVEGAKDWGRFSPSISGDGSRGVSLHNGALVVDRTTTPSNPIMLHKSMTTSRIGFEQQTRMLPLAGCSSGSGP